MAWSLVRCLGQCQAHGVLPQTDTKPSWNACSWAGTLLGWKSRRIVFRFPCWSFDNAKTVSPPKNKKYIKTINPNSSFKTKWRCLEVNQHQKQMIKMRFVISMPITHVLSKPLVSDVFFLKGFHKGKNFKNLPPSRVNSGQPSYPQISLQTLLWDSTWHLNRRGTERVWTQWEGSCIASMTAACLLNGTAGSQPHPLWICPTAASSFSDV